MNWRSAACVLIALITFFAFGYTPISDSDFWWHIAAGQWIVEHGALPLTDPFGMYSAADTVRNDTVLRGQWLGQVALYEAFNLGGSTGIIIMRALLLTGCLGLLFWRAQRLGAAAWASWAVLIPSGLLALGFTNDRPQLFSYLLAALLFLAIENYERSRARGWLWMLPLIAVVWANIHGAFLLAVALLPLYVLALWVQARLKQKNFRAQHGALALATFAFLPATLLNPNGFITYAYLFNLEGSALQNATSEYISSFALYQLGNFVPQLWVALLYILSIVACIGLWRRDWPRLVLVIFLGVIGARSYRYLAFMIFITGPYLAVGLTHVLNIKLRFLIPHYSIAMLLMLAAAVITLGVKNGVALHGGVNRNMFPAAALDALGDKNISGKIFNHMQWGGYLQWRLGSSAHLYVDGRMLDSTRLEPYRHILWATPGGIELLRRELFDVVMLPPSNRFTGERYALADYLHTQSEWGMVYQDRDAVVFVRSYGTIDPAR